MEWSDLVTGQSQSQMAIDESAIYAGMWLLLGLRVSTVNQLEPLQLLLSLVTDFHLLGGN